MIYRWARAGAIAMVLVGVAFIPSPAWGDAIMVTRATSATTIAEIFVEEDSIRVELEIGAADLVAFANMLPDEILARLGEPPEAFARRLPRFTREDFTFRADDGPMLLGRVIEMEGRRRIPRDEITGEPLPMSDEDFAAAEVVLYAALVYRMPSELATLTVTPPDGANIGFVCYHRGLPVTDFRYLSGPETLELDRADPWFSHFRNRNLRRQYSSPMHVFLYVEPFEVRVEIVTRPLDLEHWVDLGLDDRDVISAAEAPRILSQAGAFLAEHIQLSVDGELVRPSIDRIHFLRRTLRSSSVIDPPEDLATVSATLGAIYVHPRRSLPQRVELDWNLFSPRIQRLPAAATDEAGPLPYVLQPDDHVLVWENFLREPTIPSLVGLASPPPAYTRYFPWLMAAAAMVLLIVSVVNVRQVVRQRRPSVNMVAIAVVLALAIIGMMSARDRFGASSDATSDVVSTLLRNVYHAFDFRDEDLIYDTLAESVSGDLLTQTYLETRRGLELASQGGARVKVRDVTMLEVQPRRSLRDGGFIADCQWDVSGSVGHWGHIHQRTNRYQAELRVEPVDGRWKITGLDLKEEVRL